MPIDRIARFCRAEDGTVAIVASLSLTVLLGFVAIGVDGASLYTHRARLQSVSDLAAISAVARPRDATTRASHVLDKNRTPATALDVLQTGRYLRNPAIAPDMRFVALAAGSPGINAVRVFLKDDSPLYFATVFTPDDHVTLNRTALATRTGAASFTLYSHLARIEGAALNQVLMDRYGAGATISVGNMQVLADTRIDLGALLSALNTGIGSTDRNPAEILNATITNGALINALKSLLPAGVATGLNGLGSAGGATSFEVAALVGGIDSQLGLTATNYLTEVRISALDVVRAIVAAEMAGDAAVLNANAVVPGVLATTATISAGEPPARSGLVALGEEGVQLHRAAVRIRTDTAVSPSQLGNLGVGVQVTRVNLPLYAELAGSTATLTKIECGSGQPSAVAAEFATSHTPLNPANGTSVAALYLGTLAGGGAATAPINPADLGFADLLEISLTIKVPLLPDVKISGITIEARSTAAVGASRVETITYTQADVADGRLTKHFGSGNLLSTAVDSLLSPTRLQLRVKPGQEGLVSGLAAPVVAGVMALLPGQLASTLVAPVDAVLDATLTSAGVQLGEGELTLTGHHCEPIQLVQ